VKTNFRGLRGSFEYLVVRPDVLCTSFECFDANSRSVSGSTVAGVLGQISVLCGVFENADEPVGDSTEHATPARGTFGQRHSGVCGRIAKLSDSNSVATVEELGGTVNREGTTTLYCY
jgi:hypothetical protein